MDVDEEYGSQAIVFRFMNKFGCRGHPSRYPMTDDKRVERMPRRVVATSMRHMHAACQWNDEFAVGDVSALSTPKYCLGKYLFVKFVLLPLDMFHLLPCKKRYHRIRQLTETVWKKTNWTNDGALRPTAPAIITVPWYFPQQSGVGLGINIWMNHYHWLSPDDYAEEAGTMQSRYWLLQGMSTMSMNWCSYMDSGSG